MRRLSRVAGSIFPARGRGVRVRQAAQSRSKQPQTYVPAGFKLRESPANRSHPKNHQTRGEIVTKGDDRVERVLMGWLRVLHVHRSITETRRRPPPIQNSWIRQRSYARLCPLKSLLSVDERNPGQKPVDLMPVWRKNSCVRLYFSKPPRRSRQRIAPRELVSGAGKSN